MKHTFGEMKNNDSKKKKKSKRDAKRGKKKRCLIRLKESNDQGGIIGAIEARRGKKKSEFR